MNKFLADIVAGINGFLALMIIASNAIGGAVFFFGSSSGDGAAAILGFALGAVVGTLIAGLICGMIALLIEIRNHLMRIADSVEKFPRIEPVVSHWSEPAPRAAESVVEQD